MKLGFSTLGCPQWDLETIVNQAAAMGYNGVELNGLQGQAHLPALPTMRHDTKGVAGRFRDAGVELVCLATNCCFHWPDAVKMDEHQRQTREFIELAGKLGCPYVRVFGGQVPRGEAKTLTLRRIAEALRDLAGTAAAHGVTILLENEGDFACSRDVWYIVDTVNLPAVRACWHICHAQAGGDRPSVAIPRLNSRIALTHVVDGRFAPNGTLAEYLLPGAGTVDLGLAIDLLGGIGYDGYLMFEWPKSRVTSLAAPEEALPTALAKLKAMLAELASVKELTAYKGDKNAPRYAQTVRPVA